MNNNNKVSDERIIKEFKFDKSQQALVHPYVKAKTKYSQSIDVYLITSGHLWIYRLIEQYGYGKYLNELIIYSANMKSNLLEWELTDLLSKDIEGILSKYKIEFVKYIDEELNIMNYKRELDYSKDKEHPYHRLTRLLILMKYPAGNQLIGDLDLNSNAEVILEEKGSIINAAYLGVEIINKQKGINTIEIPKILETIIMNNISCHVEYQELRYYPKIEVIVLKISNRIDEIGRHWYTFSDAEQVIISKLLYSLRLVTELVITLIGTNGILSTFVTRTLFDNFWQSKYLIENNEVDKYRNFALDRMRLHILKRADRSDISSINELLSEIEGGVLDPIPIHGDYFSKSAREYAILLGIKDEYDKYYEYNSEFIHASLTAIYSGLMKQCDNPEHNKHLTINPGVSSYIDSMKHIFEIINMHIGLVNDFLGFEFMESYDEREFFYKDRKEFSESMPSSFHENKRKLMHDKSFS